MSRAERNWDRRCSTPGAVSKVALSADGKLALTICKDRSAHLWDTQSCKPLTRPLKYEVPVRDGMFNADGTVILFRCDDGTARLYGVPPQLPDNASIVRAWAQARTGFNVDEQGVFRKLTQAEWLASQEELVRARKKLHSRGRS